MIHEIRTLAKMIKIAICSTLCTFFKMSSTGNTETILNSPTSLTLENELVIKRYSTPLSATN